MMKYLKRRRASEEEDSGDEQHLAGKSTSKVAKVGETKKIRSYNDTYLAFGFTWTGEQNCQLPLCIVCGKTLVNAAMFPAKLQRHFTTNHSQLLNKDIDYFQRLLKSNGKACTMFEKKVTVSNKAQEASYMIAELVAKQMKSHTIAESLILPACKIMAKIMLGQEAADEFSKVPLSDNTISRRITDMSHNIENSLSEILKCTNFALQVDESTDITGKAQLLAFVRFENEGKIVENFSFCKELPETTKGQDIFNLVSSYLETCGLSWMQCVGIYTDGAPAMIGSIKGFVTLVKEKNPAVITTHCFIHREVLCSQTIGEDLKEVLDVTVNMINFVKQRPLKTRIFAKLCENMHKDHVTLLLHSEVRWLSRGKILTRVYEMREELLTFFKNNKKVHFTDCLEDAKWVQKLAYLADIFRHLNSLNTSMQGPNENILTSTDKIIAFQNKLKVWKKYISRGNVEMFPLLYELRGATADMEVVAVIGVHLEILSNRLDNYFPSLSVELYDWIRNPFTELSSNSLNMFRLQEEEELTELQSDRSLKLKFNEVSLDMFWLSIKAEFPLVAAKVLSILLQFSTSYLCEQAFSCLTNIKSKSRNRLLSVEEELRVCLSKIRPGIEELCKEKQAQVSH